MAVYTDAIQKLYVAYFSRPADVAGLAYWEGVVTAAKGSTAAVSAAFAASAEYKAAFAGLDEYHIVDQIYLNLFGRHAEPAGLQFWGQNLIAKKITVDSVVTAVAAGAQGTDLVAYNSKVTAATSFTAALDTSSEILGYSGPAANAGAANFIAGVTDAATLAAAIAPANLDAVVLAVTTPQPVGTTFDLTTGVDVLTGTNANDTFVGNVSIFDSINGGAGNDTLNLVDTTTGGTSLNGAGATIAGVETVSILSAGSVTANTSTFAGTTKLNVTTVSTTGAVSATVANTTDVFVNTAGSAGVTVAGGKGVIVTNSSATAGAVSIVGSGLTAVSVSGGSTVNVDNTDPAATTPSGAGVTLTSATIFGATGATTLSGAALTNLNLQNLTAGVTVNNTTAHALNATLSSVGTAATAVTLADAAATTANITAVTASNIALSGAKFATANLSGAGSLTVNAAGSAAVKTIAGASATGDITLTGLGVKVNTITTGSGADTFTVTTMTSAATATVAAVNATVSSGAGNDAITLALGTAGTGAVSVSAGDGDDSVTVNSRGAEVITIDLGAGTDTFNVATSTSINAGDTVSGGAGLDTLALNLVGSANIGAFSGFELFDAIALNKTLDVDILASKNTVTEIVASAGVGAAILTNVGAGVGVRATGDMAGSTLTVTQKVAGAITVTADMDEKANAATADLADAFGAAVNLTNATTANIVFGTDFLASTTAEKLLAVDNTATLTVTSLAVTSASVVAGGSLANDVLVYNDTGAKLAALTVTGAQALNLSIVGGATASVDASAATGGLTFSTASLKALGTVKLGSGVDKITVAATSTDVNPESISGFEKTLSISVTADATDAAQVKAAAAAVADADVMIFTGGTVANASTITGGAVTAKGVLTFSGAGPADLNAAFVIANAAAETAGEVLVFNYLGDSYVFEQGGLATDTVVKLVGTIGITNIVETGTDMFFIV